MHWIPEHRQGGTVRGEPDGVIGEIRCCKKHLQKSAEWAIPLSAKKICDLSREKGPTWMTSAFREWSTDIWCEVPMPMQGSPKYVPKKRKNFRDFSLSLPGRTSKTQDWPGCRPSSMTSKWSWRLEKCCFRLRKLRSWLPKIVTPQPTPLN